VRLDAGDARLVIAARGGDDVAEGVVLVPRDAPWSAPPPQGAEVRATAAPDPARSAAAAAAAAGGP
jgi:hypothetical protein